MNKELLTTGVIVYNNVFDPKNFVDLIEEESNLNWPYLTWEYSGTDAGTISFYRTSYQMELQPIMSDNVPEENRLHEASKIWMNCFREIDKCVFDYREQYNLSLEADEGYRILKYPSGSEYLSHADAGMGSLRQLSMVGWLNDDYEGGELEFDYFGIKIKPKAGSLVIFPSNYLYRHTAYPVKEDSTDIKYVFVTWFR